MYGTLAGVLAARKVDFDRSSYSAEVEGTIEGPSPAAIRISTIHVAYRLRLPAAQRAAADRALALHAEACAAHQSVKDSITVSWSAEVEEF